MRTLAVALAATMTGVLVSAPAAQARQATGAQPPIKVEGWSTFSRTSGVAVQAKPSGTIHNCYNGYNGQREVNVVFIGRIRKGAKFAVGLWGGPSNGFFTHEPTKDELRQQATAWSHAKSKPTRVPYGVTFAGGPYGPENIDGTWHAKFFVAGDIVKRSEVTIACR